MESEKYRSALRSTMALRVYLTVLTKDAAMALVWLLGPGTSIELLGRHQGGLVPLTLLLESLLESQAPVADET